jgi:cytochrome c556
MPFSRYHELSSITALALIFSLAGAVFVDASPADIAASKARQDKMRDMGSAFKAINDELKKSKPDWDNIIQMNADTVQNRSSYLLKWFPKGSGPEAGVKTYALPIIWQKQSDFTKLGNAAAAEAAKLKDVASSKDAAALKVQYVKLGKACKACHDTYRSPDYEKENDD